MRLTEEQLALFSREAISWRLAAKEWEQKGDSINATLAYTQALCIENTVIAVAAKLQKDFVISSWRQCCNPDLNPQVVESIQDEKKKWGK